MPTAVFEEVEINDDSIENVDLQMDEEGKSDDSSASESDTALANLVYDDTRNWSLADLQQHEFTETEVKSFLGGRGFAFLAMKWRKR